MWIRTEDGESERGGSGGHTEMGSEEMKERERS